MTARPTARVKAAIDAVRAAGLTIAAVKVAADGAVEVQTTDDPRLVPEKPPAKHQWSAA